MHVWFLTPQQPLLVKRKSKIVDHIKYHFPHKLWLPPSTRPGDLGLPEDTQN